MGRGKRPRPAGSVMSDKSPRRSAGKKPKGLALSRDTPVEMR
jgi:hypothetical protein